MKQETKDRLLSVFKTAIEIYLVWIAAKATYQISGDWQLVIAIEGVMISMWLMGVFGGNGGKALAIKPFAFLVAWILYAGQLVIGWEAFPDVVSILARVGTAGLLLFDSWAYVVALRQWATRKQTAQTNTLAQTDWKRGVRVIVANVGYALAAVLVWPLVFCFQVVRLLAEYALDVLSALRLRVSTDTPSKQADYRPLTQTMIAPPPVTQARKQANRAVVSARYYQTDIGRWAWVCECGASSETQTRGQTDYNTHFGAQKGFAGHMQKHSPELAVTYIEPERVEL